MFYAGAPFVTRGYAFRNYDYREPLGQVERFLASYGVESTVQHAATGAGR
jgi:4-hydroxyphenylacetate 3-monooxygenase